jgi:hypothetical protein
VINAKKMVAVCTGALGITAGVAVYLPATASAASYGGQCGTGYNVIDHKDIGDVATIFLTYNNSDGNDCVVTVRNHPGAAIDMLADVSKAYADGSTSDYTKDEGNYTTYAGPVKVHAPGICIKWGGGAAGGAFGNQNVRIAGDGRRRAQVGLSMTPTRGGVGTAIATL